MKKMTINIGERTVKDLTHRELIDFMWAYGYCGAPEYWHKPTLEYMEYCDTFNSMHFKYSQKGKTGQQTISSTGFIRFTFNEDERPVIFIERHHSFPFTIKQLNHFIKLGFYFDIASYNSA